MTFSAWRRAGALVALGSALSNLSTPTLADSNEFSADAAIEVAALVPGGSTALRVRSPQVGALSLILTDSTRGILDLGGPLPLLSLSGAAVVFGSGVIGPDGTFTLSTATPAAGTVFYAQAVLLRSASDIRASRAIEVAVQGPATTSFDQDTASLGPDARNFSTQDVDFADLDRDGCPDAITANDGAGAVPLVLMGSCSTFENEAALRLPAVALRPTACVEAADVNNDGWPDLFLGGGFQGGSPSPNLLAINDGTGSFFLASSIPDPRPGFSVLLEDPCEIGKSCYLLPPGSGMAVDAEFGDVDADGDLDLFVISIEDPFFPGEAADPVTLYINQGGLQGGTLGSFAERTAFGNLPGNTPHTANGDVSLGDLDGDGDLDVFVAAPGLQNQLYVNDGLGGFTEVTATAIPAEVDETFEADFGDFDGDGDLDIFLANNIAGDPTAIHMLENRTVTADAPVFVDASAKLPPSFGPTTNIRLGCDVGDLDSDGDLDIAVTIHELAGMGGVPDGESVLLINQGGAQGGPQGEFLVAAGWEPGIFIAADVALEDIDADGDLDLYLANNGNLFQFDFHDELWIND